MATFANASKSNQASFAKKPTVKSKRSRARDWALRRNTGDRICKLILIALADLLNARGVAIVSQDDLAAAVECSTITIRRKLCQLEAAGYLRTISRRTRKGYKAANGYVLQVHLDGDLRQVQPIKKIVKKATQKPTNTGLLPLIQSVRPTVHNERSISSYIISRSPHMPSAWSSIKSTTSGKLLTGIASVPPVPPRLMALVAGAAR